MRYQGFCGFVILEDTTPMRIEVFIKGLFIKGLFLAHPWALQCVVWTILQGWCLELTSPTVALRISEGKRVVAYVSD